MAKKSEKTFGPSPESTSKSKRQQAQRKRRSTLSRKTANLDESDVSDSLFLPSDKDESPSKKRATGRATRFHSHPDEPSDHSCNESVPAKETAPIVIAMSKRHQSKSQKPPPKIVSSKKSKVQLAIAELETVASSSQDNAVTNVENAMTNIPDEKEDHDMPMKKLTIVKAKKAAKGWEPPAKAVRQRKSTRGEGSEVADGKPETQKPIDQWPDALSCGLEGTSSEKVPTELCYKDEGYTWGFQIAHDAKRLQWFKLQLDPNLANIQSSYLKDYPDPKAAPSKEGQSTESLVTDYLTALRIHFEAVFKKNLPPSISSTANLPFEWVITVPAVWSEVAVATTKACAERAGMGNSSSIRVVPEPEAAAVYALRQMVPYGVKPGDAYIICDAGGGTVDLISYKITARFPNMKVVEVAAGRGLPCGSCFLNRRFASFLQAKLGDHEAWREDIVDEALKRFEREVKRSYLGSKTADYFVPVPAFPDDKTLGVRGALFRIKGAELFEIFEPIIKDIIKLVTQQVEETYKKRTAVEAIVMVGGFGQNEYLMQRVQQAVADRNIAVYKPPYGWTAVVRGALMKGLAEANSNNAVVTITGRIARNHYGTPSAKAFDSSLHLEEHRYWSTSNERDEVNTYDWFITKV
ncbi:MAG: hypothetical protein Q9170_002398 [Blastenia crenularia]